MRRASRLREPHEGRKQFSCTIQGIEGEEVLIITKEGEAHALRFSDIASARLVLTDEARFEPPRRSPPRAPT